MKSYFVDSNVFLRFITRDDADQSIIAERLFLQAKAGEIELFCGPPVFFEVAWVLRAVYKLENAAILDILESMLSIPNLAVSDADSVTRAIAMARRQSLGFADSYIAVTALGKNIGVATFNRAHFEKTGAVWYPFDKG
ncbi:MAG: PIN domain-containing protein [Zoogloeaceae bacterium]|jgi:predicted nucleic acid-binding protein|nr:PIN domain-containing protein [Zoogloeaceae bacterium]